MRKNSFLGKIYFLYPLMIITAFLAACSTSAYQQNDVGSDITDTIGISEYIAVADFLSEETSIPEIPLTALNVSTCNAAQGITGELKIAFLDVGQADCIYIILPNGETILIDAGNLENSGQIIKHIKDSKKNTLDYVIATHPHADHIGGMATVLKEFNVKSVWMPDLIHTTKTFESLLDTIEEKDLTFNVAKAGEILFDYGDLKCEFIAPTENEYNNINNYSAIIRLTYKDRHFLFMGDAEKESEKEILDAGNDIKADVLKVGHHGGRTSSSEAFIQKVAPEYAVISVGEGNSYGHPSPEILAICNRLNIEVYRTDTNGTIIITCDGDCITVDSFKTEIQPRAPSACPKIKEKIEVTPEESAETQKQDITVYITKTGTKYHADGCRYLGQSKIKISLEQVQQKYAPCSVCKPPRQEE